MGRILLADDEPDVVWALRRSLRAGGHEVITARDGVETLALARRHPPDLILLDITMPALDGLQVLRRLRDDSGLAAVPVLILSARSSVEDRVKGLEGGGDDYLIKPFDLRELQARIRALLRRVWGGTARDPSRIAISTLVLDAKAREVRVGDKAVHVTPIEFDLLYLFLSHPGELFSHEDLLQLVWGYGLDAGGSGVVRWHIKRLRDKIEADPLRPVYIRTVSGHGYGLGEGLTAERRGQERRRGDATGPVAASPDVAVGGERHRPPPLSA